jgi:hypothetical protein
VLDGGRDSNRDVRESEPALRVRVFFVELRLKLSQIFPGAANSSSTTLLVTDTATMPEPAAALSNESAASSPAFGDVGPVTNITPSRRARARSWLCSADRRSD